jgi:phage-related protein
MLATLVLPDGQGAAAGIRPGDALIRYGETPLDSAQQLVALTGETSPEQTVTLRWLRPGAEGQAETLEASIRGGRIGIGVRDLAETPEGRIQAVRNGGVAAMQDARDDEAERLFRRGLDLATVAGNTERRGRSLMLLGTPLAEQGRDPASNQRTPAADKRVIGADLKTVQYGWPIGMPVVRKLEAGLREVRSHLDRRIARILFTVTDGRMILLHGFIKKSQKTPADDLALARRRRTQLTPGPHSP